jgi:hypothetical protein
MAKVKMLDYVLFASKYGNVCSIKRFSSKNPLFHILQLTVHDTNRITEQKVFAPFSLIISRLALLFAC